MPKRNKHNKRKHSVLPAASPLIALGLGLGIGTEVHANEAAAPTPPASCAGLTELSKDADVSKLDVVKSFEAKKLKNEILEMYREIRAELSKIQRQTLERSLSNVGSAHRVKDVDLASAG